MDKAISEFMRMIFCDRGGADFLIKSNLWQNIRKWNGSITTMAEIPRKYARRRLFRSAYGDGIESFRVVSDVKYDI